MKNLKKMAIALAAVAAVASVSAQSVSFSSASGSGYIPKDAIQNVTGWNNNIFQRNAGSVAFELTRDVTYTAGCAPNDNANANSAKTVSVTLKTVETMVKEARLNGNGSQVLGFNIRKAGSAAPASLPTTCTRVDNDGTTKLGVLVSPWQAEVGALSGPATLNMVHGGVPYLIGAY